MLATTPYPIAEYVAHKLPSGPWAGCSFDTDTERLSVREQVVVEVKKASVTLSRLSISDMKSYAPK
jgi:hypothetical protein